MEIKKHDYWDDHTYKEKWNDFKGVNNIELFEDKNSIPFSSEESDEN